MNKMNALPEEVTRFLENPFATICETCNYRNQYNSDYWRDSTKMGQKMGSLLLSNPHLADETVLQVLGNLTNGECRGLRLYLLNSNNGREILEHILQIHPKGRSIIYRSYVSYKEGRGYMGSILEDNNIYLWEDQALHFLANLISWQGESEMEEEAFMRCSYAMANRLQIIPGTEAYENIVQDYHPFLSRLFPEGGDLVVGSPSVARFWAFYLCAHPEHLTPHTLDHISTLFDMYFHGYFYYMIMANHPNLLEDPRVQPHYTAWRNDWEEEWLQFGDN